MPLRYGRARNQSPGLLAAALSCACLATGCNGGDTMSAAGDGGCEAVTEASLDCTPAFDPPDFSAIYANVIEKRCGSGDKGCHGDGAPSGLVMSDPAQAHAYLLGEIGDGARVVPGHPECSELLMRLQSSDRRVRMPLNGAALDSGAICAVRQWIASGAEGP